jgi:hypothetical protein
MLRCAIRIGRRLCRHVRRIGRILMCPVESRRFCPRCVAVLELKIIVARHVARLFGPLDFFKKLVNYYILDHFPALGINWMSNICVKFCAAIGVFGGPRIGHPLAALIAILRAKMVFHSAAGAVRRQLAARHGHKRPIGAIDNFQIAHDKAIVERDRTKRLEAFTRLFHELDANFSDFHGVLLARRARPIGNCEWRKRAQVASYEEY